MSEDLQRLSSIIADSSDAIIAKDLEGTITLWNPAAERLFGYLAEEALGAKIEMLAPPDRPDEMKAILARIKRGSRVNQFVTERRHKSGRVIEVSLTVSPIMDTDGNVIGAVKIVRDATTHMREQRRMERMSDVNHRLLREMNHRVGNNLAIIVSLLRQAKKTMNEESKEAIDGVIEKIYTLGAEHEERLLRDSSHFDDTTD